jgi:glyoxalase/bleomycin resistance protein/dioxygenase superfamily protein
MTISEQLGPIHHYGYAVSSLDDALEHWLSELGAGPFFRMDDVPFDSAESGGQPCVFEHSMALGKWGGMFVELQEIHNVQPDSLAPLLRSGAEPAVSHVAYACVDAEAQSARLEALGLPVFLTARVGPICARYHDAPSLGHGIEIHDKNNAFSGLYGMIDAASVGWDGTDRVRAFPAMR